MSRYQHIEVKLLPAYGSGGLQRAFPNLAAFLQRSGRNRLLREEISLFHLVESLERLAADPAVEAPGKAGLERLLPQLRKVRDEAREHLLGYRLKELDRSLYRLEDLFSDLEEEWNW